jgi:hypothetical protein
LSTVASVFRNRTVDAVTAPVATYSRSSSTSLPSVKAPGMPAMRKTRILPSPSPSTKASAAASSISPLRAFMFSGRSKRTV